MTVVNSDTLIIIFRHKTPFYCISHNCKAWTSILWGKKKHFYFSSFLWFWGDFGGGGKVFHCTICPHFSSDFCCVSEQTQLNKTSLYFRRFKKDLWIWGHFSVKETKRFWGGGAARRQSAAGNGNKALKPKEMAGKSGFWALNFFFLVSFVLVVGYPSEFWGRFEGSVG